nr:immunoglobulin heavy chain junction region [Macaca mulatta]
CAYHIRRDYGLDSW